MKRTLVRYKTKLEKAEENAALIEHVFDELRLKSPDGVRYLVLRLADGTFVHFVELQEGAPPVTALEAFRTFQSGHGERTVEPPVTASPTIVGNYRMLAE
jgi:hypothetical protein